MSTHLPWAQVALRLALSALAGAMIGLNREEHGHQAGLRTCILVCLAASFAMVEANLLLHTDGKPSGSFATADILRLPLGILDGMGFIGAGAIVRRHDLVTGVTTAATLWFVTVMGLCFGGGFLALGLAALLLGWGTLRGVKRIEARMPREQRATLELSLEPGTLEAELRSVLEQAGYRIAAAAVTHHAREGRLDLVWAIRWRSPPSLDPPPFLAGYAGNPALHRIAWHPDVLPAVK